MSIRALSILRNLGPVRRAKLLQVLSSACITHFTLDGVASPLDVRVPSLGRNAGENSLQDFGLSFGNLNILNEHGLIISDYNSWYDMQYVHWDPDGPRLRPDGSSVFVRIPFEFQARHWVLTPSVQETRWER